MFYSIQIKEDKANQRYLAFQVSDIDIDYERILSHHIQEIKKKLKEKKCPDDLIEKINVIDYMQNQKNRDNDTYHVTVMNVAFWNKLTQEDQNSLLQDIHSTLLISQEFIKPIGIGCQFNEKDISIFEVLKIDDNLNDVIQEYRNKYDIPSQDYHMTLGFSRKDVHRKPKTENELFIHYENHFIKKIKIR